MERMMDTKLQDKKLVCCDCGTQFIFTVGEEAYYRSKRLTIPPKRCKSCRERRRATIVPDDSKVQ